MKDTRNFDRVPLKDIRVKDNQIGIRTPQILISRKKGDYMKGDVLDANAVIQAFDELKGNVDNDHDSLQEIVDELHNLRDATDQSFEVFQEKAEEEAANRIQGDKTLGEKINTEQKQRESADTQLRNNLNAEINRATTKESKMETTFTEEINKKANSTELATLRSKVAELEQRIVTLESKQAA